MAIDIAGQLSGFLKEYLDEIVQVTNAAIDETAEEAVNILKATSPRRTKGAKSYANKWSHKVIGSKLGIKSVALYNRKAGLTHLLEYGHATRNGGRAAARPHIAAVEEQAGEILMNKIQEKLS